VTLPAGQATVVELLIPKRAIIAEFPSGVRLEVSCHDLCKQNDVCQQHKEGACARGKGAMEKAQPSTKAESAVSEVQITTPEIQGPTLGAEDAMLETQGAASKTESTMQGTKSAAPEGEEGISNG
jgi:hypothetical protein